MDKIQHSTATESNLFTEGDPSSGAPATVVTANWLNGVQGELVAVIEGAGITLDGEDQTQLRTAIDGLIAASAGAAISPFDTMPIGERFSLDTHLPGVVAPSNAGSSKFIELTAGLTGSGEYNEGLLINEVTTGSGRTLQVTAEIDGVGANDGGIVHLVNTEGAFTRPGEVSGIYQQDELKAHTHSYTAADALGNRDGGVNSTIATKSGKTTGSVGGLETRPKNVSSVFYMRIS